jgi:hypothetical protein
MPRHFYLLCRTCTIWFCLLSVLASILFRLSCLATPPIAILSSHFRHSRPYPLLPLRLGWAWCAAPLLTERTGDKAGTQARSGCSPWISWRARRGQGRSGGRVEEVELAVTAAGVRRRRCCRCSGSVLRPAIDGEDLWRLDGDGAGRWGVGLLRLASMASASVMFVEGVGGGKGSGAAVARCERGSRAMVHMMRKWVSRQRRPCRRWEQ